MTPPPLPYLLARVETGVYNVYVIYEILYLSQIQFVFGVSNAFYTVYTSYQFILIHKCLGINREIKL